MFIRRRILTKVLMALQNGRLVCDKCKKDGRPYLGRTPFEAYKTLNIHPVHIHINLIRMLSIQMNIRSFKETKNIHTSHNALPNKCLNAFKLLPVYRTPSFSPQALTFESSNGTDPPSAHSKPSPSLAPPSPPSHYSPTKTPHPDILVPSIRGLFG